MGREKIYVLNAEARYLHPVVYTAQIAAEFHPHPMLGRARYRTLSVARRQTKYHGDYDLEGKIIN